MKNLSNLFVISVFTIFTCFSASIAEVTLSPYGISIATDEGDVEEVEVTVANIGDEDIVFSWIT